MVCYYGLFLVPADKDRFTEGEKDGEKVVSTGVRWKCGSTEVHRGRSAISPSTYMIGGKQLRTDREVLKDHEEPVEKSSDQLPGIR